MNNKLFIESLERVLLEASETKYRAAVGVVQCGNKWLLGLAKDTNDDRDHKWVFPGGHIKRGEATKKAAEREVFEETGIKCKAIGDPFALPGKPDIAFVHCKAASRQKIDFNSEFTAVGFFTVQELKGLKLYENVRKLISKVS